MENSSILHRASSKAKKYENQRLVIPCPPAYIYIYIDITGFFFSHSLKQKNASPSIILHAQKKKVRSIYTYKCYLRGDIKQKSYQQLYRSISVVVTLYVENWNRRGDEKSERHLRESTHLKARIGNTPFLGDVKGKKMTVFLDGS